MSRDIDIEAMRSVLMDDRLHIMVALVKRVAVSSDRAICRVVCSVLPENRLIIATMSWDVVGADAGLFMLPEVDDLVLVGQAEGDKDQAYILRRLTSRDEKIPLNAVGGDFVLKARAGKKVWITSPSRINLSKTDTEPTENLVLGQVLKTLLSSLLNDIATHTHAYDDAGTPSVTQAPGNASAFTALKANPVDNAGILSTIAFTEKG